MMTVVKKSVAFDLDVAREAVERAGDRGFSRLVNDAVEQHLQAMRIADLYSEFVNEHGSVPDAIRREVAAEWVTTDDRS